MPELIISPEEKAKVLKIFNSYDLDGNGTIETDEFLALAKKLGRKISDEEADAAVAALDLNGDGVIDFNEFLDWYLNPNSAGVPLLTDLHSRMLEYRKTNVMIDAVGSIFGLVVPKNFSYGKLMKQNASAMSASTTGGSMESDSRKRIRKIFEAIDTDGSGAIDEQEFRVMLEKMGQTHTEMEVKTMLREVDLDGNGTIEFDEFYTWWVRDHKEDADWAHKFGNLFRTKKTADKWRTHVVKEDGESSKESGKEKGKVKPAKKTAEAQVTPRKTVVKHAKPKVDVADGDIEKSAQDFTSKVVSAVQTLRAENAELRSELDEIKAQLAALNGGSKQTVSKKKVEPDVENFDVEKSASSSDSYSPVVEKVAPVDTTAQRKKKGKRKSKKPEKLESSSEFETSDEGAKRRSQRGVHAIKKDEDTPSKKK